jgi:kynureninase
MKNYFSKTLQFHEKHLLFQAHSHHCWPDAAFLGMEEYQHLVQKKLDDKWDYVFDSIIPRSQKIFARLLGWPHPQHITLGTNTQELLIRFLSSFIKDKPVTLLTTNFEYHSARRLFQSLAQIPQFSLKVAECSYHELEKNLHTKLTEAPIDICFLSQAFFKTGYTLDEKILLNLAKTFPQTFFIFDTYHSAGARVLNFFSERKNIALIGGGYKYIMSGEGCCYLALHPQAQLSEPLLNGWMAEFSALDAQSPSVHLPPVSTQGHMRFMGATFDPIGLFRLCHVWEFFEQQKITPFMIKNHVKQLQDYFLQTIDYKLKNAFCLYPAGEQGNFLSLTCKNTKAANQIVKLLKERLVFTDSRDQFVRLGFGIYQDKEDILELACVLNSLLANVESMLELPA